jgi:hypothetical protein
MAPGGVGLPHESQSSGCATAVTGRFDLHFMIVRAILDGSGDWISDVALEGTSSG